MAGVALLPPSMARACPETTAPPAAAVFTTAGAITRAGGTLTDHRGHGPETVRADLGGTYAGVSPDGAHLVTVEAVHVAGDGVAPCTATHLWARIGSPERAPLPRIARLRGDSVRGLRFSPSGRFVALSVHGLPVEAARRRRGPDQPALGPDRVHVFDLHTRRRRHLFDGAEVTFLDDGHFLLREARGRVSLYALGNGERLRVLAPPARRLRPFAEGANAEGFFATARMGTETRLVRVHLGRPQVRLEILGPALTVRPASISADGKRGAWLREGRAVVGDLGTGLEIASFPAAGPAEERAIAISPDGGSVVFIAAGEAEVHALGIPGDGGVAPAADEAPPGGPGETPAATSPGDPAAP